jgi:hypothetical protein
MAIRCTIDGRVLLFEAVGEYQLPGVKRALDTAIASPDLQAPMCMLADARDSVANPSFDEIQETASYLVSIREQFQPIWILVVRGSLRFGLARMLSVFTGEAGIELMVQRDFDEGLRVARECAA